MMLKRFFPALFIVLAFTVAAPAQEVEEEVRKERYEKLWKQYGNYIIVAAALIVAAVAAFQAWQRYDQARRERVSDQFQQATQLAASGNYVRAETEFAALSKDAPANPRAA